MPDPGDPQSLNRYSYVLNNVLKYTDPTGHYTFEEDPDDSWIYSDSEVRSKYYFTHPEYKQKQLSDGEFVGTLVAIPAAVATTVFLMEAPAALLEIMSPACADGDCNNEAQATKNAIKSIQQELPKVQQQAIQFSKHALQRMTQRGVTLEQVQATMSNNQSFQYFHDEMWKIGYYDPVSKIMVAEANNIITTVITNVNPQYIENLLKVTPP